MKPLAGSASKASSLAAKLLAAWASRGGLTSKAERQMRVVETLSLGGRRQVHLVACAGQTFLVGCGADSVQCIAPVPASPLREELL